MSACVILGLATKTLMSVDQSGHCLSKIAVAIPFDDSSYIF